MFNLTATYPSFFIFTALPSATHEEEQTRRHDASPPLPARPTFLAQALPARPGASPAPTSAPTIKVNNMEPTRSPLPHAQYNPPAVHAQPQEPRQHAA